jgi:hypothetical protein
MHQIELVIDSLPFPRSTEGKDLMRELVGTRAFLGTAEAFAAARGLKDRQVLGEVLHQQGLPPWQPLKGWLKILYETSLSQAALLDAKNTSTYYRSVERLTKCSWTEVRNRGSAWILSQLLNELELADQARPIRRAHS